MPRRGSNIYKRKDGRFEGRVAIGHKENGALRYKYVYAHTLSELKNKMLRFQITVQKQPISSIKLTVKDAAMQPAASSCGLSIYGCLSTAVFRTLLITM